MINDLADNPNRTYSFKIFGSNAIEALLYDLVQREFMQPQ